MVYGEINEEVRNWLVKYYVVNDTIFLNNCKTRLFTQHPELEEVQNPDRQKIDQLYSIDTLVMRENKLFVPPSGPPDIDEALLDYPFRMLYSDLVNLMSEKVKIFAINPLNHDQMRSLWEDALAIALEVVIPGIQAEIYRPAQGTGRLRLLYDRYKSRHFEDQSPLVGKFNDCFLDEELKFMCDSVDKGITRLVNPKPAANEYINSMKKIRLCMDY